MDGRKKPKSKKWYEAVKRANRARRGEKREFSPTRSNSLKALWKTKGYGDRLRKERKNRWNDSGFKERQVKKLHSKEILKSHSRSMKEWWSGAENYKRMVKVRKRQANRPEEKERLAGLVKENWSNPETRKRMIRARKKQAKNPKEQVRKQETAKALWADPKFRAKQMKSRRERMYNNPEWIKKQSEARKKVIKKGWVPWNKGLTKDTNQVLKEMSDAQQGQVPDYNKYRAWYPSEKRRKIRMRSKWEVGYALYLDGKGIKWKYESRYFHVGKGKWTGISYLPDFYLTDTGWHVEVKGREGYGWKAKLKEFQKRYPDVKLKVLHAEELKKKGVLDIHGCAMYDQRKKKAA